MMLRTVRDSFDRSFSEDARDPVACDEHSLRRFISELPVIEKILAEPVSSNQELIVRSEMRRTVLSLAAVLDAAGRVETCRTRAAVLFTAARAASELAATSDHPSRAGLAH